VSFRRPQLSKPDKVTQQIVDELRGLGFTVMFLGWPVDLMVTHEKWGFNTWKLLEVKSKKKANGDVHLDPRQKKQRQFCKQHSVPYITSTREALLALGESIEFSP